jgi:hypothetical protein
MKFVEAQLLQCLAWVLRDHAMIVSGAYKLRQTEVGCGKNADGTTKFRPSTDEEKLKSAMSTMTSHCHWVGECVDYIGEHQHGPQSVDQGADTTARAKSMLRDLWDDLWEEPKNPPKGPPR